MSRQVRTAWHSEATLGRTGNLAFQIRAARRIQRIDKIIDLLRAA
jgi:hypothetical protein